jgi:hypothetical protein
MHGQYKLVLQPSTNLIFKMGLCGNMRQIGVGPDSVNLSAGMSP